MPAKKLHSAPTQARLDFDQIRAAIPKLERRIEEMKAFDVSQVQSRRDPAGEALARKIDATLLDIFGAGTVEFNNSAVHHFDRLPPQVIYAHVPHREYPLSKIQGSYRDSIDRAVLNLSGIIDVLKERLADEPSPPGPSSSPQPPSSDRSTSSSRRVFVVHGHEAGVKNTVARVLSKLDLEPIILHEQPNSGRTIIEKFEHYSDASFAVVLITPDDVGFPVGKEDERRPRARQNVVLELGFFLGALGRERVCVLYSEGVELPSDYGGVLYTPVDPGGAWQYLLAKELKAVGIDVDLNRLH